MCSLREEIAHAIYEKVRKRGFNAVLVRNDKYSTIEVHVHAWTLPIDIESIFRQLNCRLLEKKEDDYSASYTVARGSETACVGVVYMHRESDYDRYCMSLGMCDITPKILVLVY